jgi:hypothetical protein
MKKFLTRLFIFLLPVILVIGLWEYGLGKIPNSYTLKREQLEAQAPKIEVLVLGGSYSLRGINPDYFSMRGYNVANVEQSLYYDTRITLKYLDKMTSLKVVLIAISYHGLWWQVNEGQEGFRDYFYADYWDIWYPTIKCYDINVYSKILQYSNDRAFQFALNGFKANLVAEYQDNGWAPKMRSPAPINDSIGNATMAFHKNSFKKENLDNNIKDLNNLLSALKARNITPVLLSTPVTSCNYKFMEPSRLKSIDSVISGLCKTYNCKWYDYHNDARFTNDDFKDVAHLNKDGATKFSKIIDEEILKKYNSTQVSKQP